MRFTALCAVGALSALAFVALARADAREDLAKEVHEDLSKSRITCVTGSIWVKDVCGGGPGSHHFCEEANEVITDLKSDLLSADTRKRAVYRWWKFVSSDSEPWRASCMRSLLGTGTYCKTVNLAVQFDPHRNCPDAGRTNSTCWLNRDFGRQRYLLPTEENDWVQRCPVDPVERMEFEDAE